MNDKGVGCTDGDSPTRIGRRRGAPLEPTAASMTMPHGRRDAPLVPRRANERVRRAVTALSDEVPSGTRESLRSATSRRWSGRPPAERKWLNL